MLKKNKGMTLIEIIAALAIFSIISMVVFSFFGSSGKTINRTHEQSKLEDEIRLITLGFEDDIKTGRNADFTGKQVKYPSATGVDTITVTNSSGKPFEIVYAYTKSRLDNAGTKINDRFVYILEDNSNTKNLIKLKVNGSAQQEVATLSKNIKTMKLDTAVKPYKLTLELEDEKGMTRKYESFIAPRGM